MRNTNIEPVLFPVTLQPLFLYNYTKPNNDFVAVIGKVDKGYNKI